MSKCLYLSIIIVIFYYFLVFSFFYYLIDNKTVPKNFIKIVIIFYLKSMNAMKFSEIILDIALAINYFQNV